MPVLEGAVSWRESGSVTEWDGCSLRFSSDTFLCGCSHGDMHGKDCVRLGHGTNGSDLCCFQGVRTETGSGESSEVDFR